MQETQFVIVNQCLYHYRIRENSLSHTMHDTEWVLKEDGLTHYLSLLIKNDFSDINHDIFEAWVLNRKLYALKFLAEKYDSVVALYHFDSPRRLLRKKLLYMVRGQLVVIIFCSYLAMLRFR